MCALMPPAAQGGLLRQLYNGGEVHGWVHRLFIRQQLDRRLEVNLSDGRYV